MKKQRAKDETGAGTRKVEQRAEMKTLRPYMRCTTELAWYSNLKFIILLWKDDKNRWREKFNYGVDDPTIEPIDGHTDHYLYAYGCEGLRRNKTKENTKER